MIKKRKISFIIVIALLLSITIVQAQNTSGNDSGKSKDKGMEYSGIKAVQTNNGNAIFSSYNLNENERVINDTELTYSGNWEFGRLLARSRGYFCNTNSTSKQDGATASYSFTDCEGIVWFYSTLAH